MSYLTVQVGVDDFRHQKRVNVAQIIFESMDRLLGSGRFNQHGLELKGDTSEQLAKERLAKKIEWANAIQGYTPKMIKRGIEKTMGNTFPPTLGNFLAACKMSAEEAFYEAQAGISARSQGRFGEWTCLAVYHAAVEFGLSELKTSNWNFQKARWTRFYDANFEKQLKDELGAIPPPISTDNRIDYQPTNERAPEVAEKIEQITQKTKHTFSNAISWAMRCISMSAAQKLADGLNGVHKSTLEEAGKVHLKTGKLARDGNTWKVGSFWV